MHFVFPKVSHNSFSEMKTGSPTKEAGSRKRQRRVLNENRVFSTRESTALGLVRFDQNDFLDLSSHRALRATCAAFAAPELMCQRDKTAVLIYKVLHPEADSPAIAHVLKWVKTCSANVMGPLCWQFRRLEMDVASDRVEMVLDKFVSLLEDTFGTPDRIPEAWETGFGFGFGLGATSFSKLVSKRILELVTTVSLAKFDDEKWAGFRFTKNKPRGTVVRRRFLPHDILFPTTPESTPFNYGTLVKVAWALRRCDAKDIGVVQAQSWCMLFRVYSSPRAPVCLLLESMPEEERTKFFNSNFRAMTRTLLDGMSCQHPKERLARPFAKEDTKIAFDLLRPFVDSATNFKEIMRIVYWGGFNQKDFAVFIGLVLAFMEERGIEVVLDEIRDIRIEYSVYVRIFKAIKTRPEYNTPEKWSVLWQCIMTLPCLDSDEMDSMFEVFPPSIWANDAALIFHALNLSNIQLRLVTVLLGGHNPTLIKHRVATSRKDRRIVEKVLSVAKEKATDPHHWMYSNRYTQHFFGMEPSFF